jgi:quinol-cytochrome oxidoreductase complex cytochrome b subunit
MFYNPDPLYAYESVIAINNDSYFGWWARFLHANGASFFFAVVYVHMARGIFYGSYTFPKQYL